MIDMILNNWWILVIFLVMIVLVVYGIILFVKCQKDKQITKVKEWLFYAVMVAEKELGSGTGQLKLRYVYDMFIVKFPRVSIFMSFDKFSSLVENSLQKFKRLLETNDSIKQYINAGSKECIVEILKSKTEGDM